MRMLLRAAALATALTVPTAAAATTTTLQCTPATCEDGNACTTNVCNPLTGCQFPPLPDGASCTDANACNGLETCTGGQCMPGTPLNCVDANPCTADSCDPVAGVCRYTPLADGTSCGDGSVCTGVELCLGGFCAPGTPLDCGDDNPCTIDTCHPVSGCTYANAPEGTPCPDQVPCNGAETCQGDVCAPGMPIPEGGPCDDGDACNGNETCQAGACLAGEGLDCDDHDPCTTDSCDAAAGCEHETVGCDDGNPNTTDRCDPVAGCLHDAVIGGTVLLVRGDATKPAHLRLKVISKGSIILSLPPSNGSANDPVLYGGSVRLRAGVNDRTYALPARNWAYVGAVGRNLGYRYRDQFRADGPITNVLVRDRKIALARGKGPGLALAFAGTPEPVEVVLTLGSTPYCARFGGLTQFFPSTKLFHAKDAPPPPTCPQ
jgi:hypothetical protein